MDITVNEMRIVNSNKEYNCVVELFKNLKPTKNLK